MSDGFLQAVDFHQQGQLRDAELGYRQVLQSDPNHADALHLLGVVALQCGHASDALDLIRRAIIIRPTVAVYYGNLAEAQRSVGEHRQSLENSKKALDLDANFPEGHNHLGLALLALNDFTGAESAFRRAIQLRPEFASAWNNLGHALREQERLSEATDAYRECVRLAPDLPEGHNNLGQILLENEQLDEALLHCREAIRLRPEFAQAHCNLGNVLREQGKAEQALDSYQQALRLDSAIGMIHNNMAQLMQEQGRLDEALEWYQQALNLEPDTPRFHANMASALTDQERFDDAIRQYKTAIELRSDYAEAWNGLGHAYREAERSEEALAAFRRAIELRPDLAPAHNNLGQTLAEIGDLDQAEASFREAIRQEEKAIGAWSNLATHHRRHLTTDEVNRIEELLKTPWLKPSQQAAIHFALAHIFDSDGSYDRAATCLAAGNECQKQANVRRGEVYSADEHTAFADRLIENFDRSWFERVGDNRGSGSKTPVFIVGLPRSGTTLTEQIVSSHSAVHGAGELRLIRDSFESIPGVQADVRSALANIDHEFVKQQAATHLQHLRAAADDARFVADKMPDNYLYLGWILTMFPNARVIHCRRDLRDVAMSCWMTSFKSIRWANDKSDICARFRDYQRLMQHWTQTLRAEVLEIRYEDTVADVTGTASRMLDWLGLPFEQQCLNFHLTKRSIRTASVSQVRQPVYTRSVGRWKNYEQLLDDLFDGVSR